MYFVKQVLSFWARGYVYLCNKPCCQEQKTTGHSALILAGLFLGIFFIRLHFYPLSVTCFQCLHFIYLLAWGTRLAHCSLSHWGCFVHCWRWLPLDWTQTELTGILGFYIPGASLAKSFRILVPPLLQSHWIAHALLIAPRMSSAFPHSSCFCSFLPYLMKVLQFSPLLLLSLLQVT